MKTIASRAALCGALLAGLTALTVTPVFAKDTKEQAAAHGGRLIETKSGKVEVVHNEDAKTLTIYTTKADGTVLDLKDAPVLVVTPAEGTGASPKEFPFEAVAGTPGAWRAACPQVDGWASPKVSIRMGADARSETLWLRETPIVRRGVLVFGNDSLRLEAICDEAKGIITLKPLTAADTRALGANTPQVVVWNDGSEKVLATAKAPGDAGFVLADTTALKDSTDARIRVKVGEKTEEAPLVLSQGDGSRGFHGGAYVAMTTTATTKEPTRFEFLHDPTTGTVTIYSPYRTETTSYLRLDEPPALLVATDSGTKTYMTVAVRDVDGAWRITDPEFKRDRLDGKMRVRVGSDLQELDLPRMPSMRPWSPLGQR